MFADANDDLEHDADDLEYLDREQRVFDERLERIGGVFVEEQHGEVDCNSEANACAPDDYPEDPYAIDNRPGTPDDVTYSIGLQSPDADDQHVVPDVRTHHSGPPASATERDTELGTEDERDLWARNRPLVQEDVDEGVMLPLGMDEDEGERVLEAMGDEASEVAPDSATGTSATGEPSSAPEHGGFPEREE